MNYILVVAMTGIAAFASFFLKKAANSGSIIMIIKNYRLWLGGMLYVISALINIWLLQKMPYSVVVPLGAICYVWTMLISRFLLGETITIRKIAGIVCILAGIVLLAV